MAKYSYAVRRQSIAVQVEGYACGNIDIHFSCIADQLNGAAAACCCECCCDCEEDFAEEIVEEVAAEEALAEEAPAEEAVAEEADFEG